MKNRFIWGGIVFVIGLILLLVSFFVVWVLMYAIPLLILGLIIMLNKNEDKIEKINYAGGKK